MSPGSSTESYPAFARIGLRENPGKNLNQVTCPDRDSNPGHLVSQPDALIVTPQAKPERLETLFLGDILRYITSYRSYIRKRHHVSFEACGGLRYDGGTLPYLYYAIHRCNSPINLLNRPSPRKRETQRLEASGQVFRVLIKDVKQMN
ncbi:hypothetical protein ANN_08302 [Periplaneta americana]|uniref:Uncharacterized protein n=1 Tax=Periplaneta americana TaxID=6978 RepID=A0ABQ8T270_PERAM|nr:hypothetical protein ANN_08302 [Periplaneta americana]